MIPKTRCSQRRAIISLARAVSRKAKCGCHSGKVSKWRYGSIGRPRNKARMPCGNTVADFAAKGQPDIGRDRIQSTGEFGARWRTRTSTTLRSLAPEASASASSATRARVRKIGSDRANQSYKAISILPAGFCFVNAMWFRAPKTARDGGSVHGNGGSRGFGCESVFAIVNPRNFHLRCYTPRLETRNNPHAGYGPAGTAGRFDREVAMDNTLTPPVF